MSLTGHTVWVSVKEDADPKKHSNYYDGEYFVLRETPSGIVGVEMKGGYGGHDTRNFARRTHDIADDGVPSTAETFDWIEELEHFANTVKRGEKLRWVEYVYTGAGQVARQARKAYAKAEQDQKCDTACNAEDCCEKPSVRPDLNAIVDAIREAGGYATINIAMGC